MLEFSNFNLNVENVNSDIKILDPIIKIKKNNSIFNKIYIKLVYFISRNYPLLIRKFFIKDDYDIEIGFNYLIPSFLIASKKSGKKICLVHSSIEYLDFSRNYSKKIKFMNRRQLNSFNKIDKIIAISDKTRQSILDLYPNLNNKVEKIYNGYDFEKYSIKEVRKK